MCDFVPARLLTSGKPLKLKGPPEMASVGTLAWCVPCSRTRGPWGLKRVRPLARIDG
jgi:hypothetical protein